MTSSKLWAYFKVWNESPNQNGYTKRAALRVKTKALIQMDKGN